MIPLPQTGGCICGGVRFTLRDDPVTLSPDESIRLAASLLAEGTIHSLPVVDDRGDLVGMVTTGDLLTQFIVDV